MIGVLIHTPEDRELLSTLRPAHFWLYGDDHSEKLFSPYAT
jgi:hypothetical protein